MYPLSLPDRGRKIAAAGAGSYRTHARGKRRGRQGQVCHHGAAPPHPAGRGRPVSSRIGVDRGRSPDDPQLPGNVGAMQDSHRPAKHNLHWILVCAACCAASLLWSQAPKSKPTPPSETQPSPPGAPAESNPSNGPAQSGPIAIVPLDSKDPASAAMVTGALQVANGHAMIATNGAITSGTGTTEVTLPRRGVLRVCASTTVKLAADASVPKDEVAGLMMVIDHGAI